MKKAITIAVVSIVFLVLSDVYYFVDTYKWQINTQRDILLKQSLIAKEQINQYFKKTHTNLSLLISEVEITKLFDDKPHSEEVQKRLELLFTSYEDHLKELRVYDVNGNMFELRKGVTSSFISAFNKASKEESILSSIYINPQGTTITYTQPLFNQHKLVGYTEFLISLDDFFASSFYNFNLEDYHFQWVMKPNGWVVYNTLRKQSFYPELAKAGEMTKKRSWFSEVHSITSEGKEIKVLSVFNRLNFSGSNYYLVFSLPIKTIASSIASNSVVVGGISLFIIILILVVFGVFIKRKNHDERSLKKSEEALRKIVYYLPVGVVLLDSHGRIRQVNKAALKLFAYDDEDQLIGRVASDQVLFDNKKRLEKTSYSTLSNKYILTNKNNDESVILHEQMPFYLLREQYTLQVFVEVTYLEKERKSEELANKAKSTFIANISHELRTPLNSMIGMTDILMGSNLSDDDQHLLSVVKRSADTLLVLINDILDFSKIEAGRFEIESIPFNLHEEVKHTVNSFIAKANQRHIKLSWSADANLPEDFIGDPIRFRQVLTNLLSNAIKFTEKGMVQLSISETRGLNGSPALAFSVKDTGIGVRPDKQKVIFNPFAQADESTTRKYGGTGLGVTISKQLVNMMGGDISVSCPSGLSNDPDYPGANFTFTLPLRSNSNLKRINYQSITSLSLVKALIITDEPLQVRMLMKNLETLKIDYKILPPVNETIDFIRVNRKYQLMIVDHRPDFDGLAFLQEVYNNNLHTRMAIILQSSDFEPSNTSVAKQLGADVYFRKPVEYSSLKSFLYKVFPSVSERLKLPSTHANDRLNVLVAEDNALNQRLAVSLFNKIGHSIDLANNGIDALKKLENKKYDIVFMDVMMPELDGISAMKQIKASGHEVPVIAMTASVEDRDRALVFESGMDDIIMKPTKLDDLRRILDKWCTK